MNDSSGHAFISYVREDKQRVDHLQGIIEAAGVKVWRDTHSLWPGRNWKAEIRKAITENSLAFIACFSENSSGRARSYQNEELLLAVEQMRLRALNRVWFIPVRFTDCDIPDMDIGAGRTLASIHSVNLFGESWEYGLARLLGSVIRILDIDLDNRIAAPPPPLASELQSDPVLRAPEMPPKLATAGASSIAMDELTRKATPGPLAATTDQMLSVNRQGRPSTAGPVAAELSQIDAAPRQPALASIASRLRLKPLPYWLPTGDKKRIEKAARELAAMTPKEAALALHNADPEDAGAALSILPSPVVIPIFSAMDADLATELLTYVTGEVKVPVLESMPPYYVAVKIVGPLDQDSHQLKSNMLSSAIKYMKDKHAGAILACLTPSHAAYVLSLAGIHKDAYILKTIDTWKAQAIIKKMESPDW